MKLIEIINNSLKGRIIKSDVEAYNSIICQTHYSKDEVVLISNVYLSPIETEIVISGKIIGGGNDGQSCNISIFLEKELNFIDLL